MLNTNAIYGVLLSGFLCLFLSTSGYAADAAAQTPATAPAPTPTPTTTQPQKPKKGNSGFAFFVLSQSIWKAIEDSNDKVEQGTYLTTLPFYFVTDFMLSVSVSTALTSRPFVNDTQKRAAAWNNPKSMIANATEPQTSNH